MFSGTGAAFRCRSVYGLGHAGKGRLHHGSDIVEKCAENRCQDRQEDKQSEWITPAYLEHLDANISEYSTPGGDLHKHSCPNDNANYFPFNHSNVDRQVVTLSVRKILPVVTQKQAHECGDQDKYRLLDLLCRQQQKCDCQNRAKDPCLICRYGSGGCAAAGE